MLSRTNYCAAYKGHLLIIIKVIIIIIIIKAITQLSPPSSLWSMVNYCKLHQCPPSSSLHWSCRKTLEKVTEVVRVKMNYTWNVKDVKRSTMSSEIIKCMKCHSCRNEMHLKIISVVPLNVTLMSSEVTEHRIAFKPTKFFSIDSNSCVTVTT